MVFFRLGRPWQVALVGAAMAAGPSCYSSGGDAADTPDADAPDDAVADGGADADAAADADADTAGDADVAADADEDADADADAADDAVVEVDTWEVVDPPPPPMCADVPAYTMSTATTSSDTEKAVAQVTLTGAVRPYGEPCAGAVCLAVTAAAGGTIESVVAIDGNNAHFTYSNPALASWSPERLDLVWRLTCTLPTGGDGEETATGTAWACRDWASNAITIVNNEWDCPMVVDPPPPPMARSNLTGGRTSGGEFRLLAGPERNGAVRLRAEGDAVSFKWTSLGGSLERLSDAEAVFRFDPASRTGLVQVAAVRPDGVSVQLYRRHRG